LDVASLLGGHREEREIARQVIERARLEQAHRCAQHARDLRVVATGVRRAGLRISLGMPGDAQAVQLADDREGGPGPAAATRVGADAGHREPDLGSQPQATERLLDEAGRLHLLESHLRLLPDPLADADDLPGATIDGREDLARQLLPRHGERMLADSGTTGQSEGKRPTADDRDAISRAAPVSWRV